MAEEPCDYKDILSNLAKNAVLRAKEEQAVCNALEYKAIPKKQYLLRAGEVCNFEAYVKKGCIRTYYLNSTGLDVTLGFAVEDWWVSDIASFHEQSPSALYIETLEDSEVYLLRPDKKERLLQAVPKLERIFRLMMQRNIAVLQNRLINTISKTATQRYVEFTERYKGVVQRVPQYYIASYLGVSPEFISTIRKRLAAKHSDRAV